MTMTTDEAQPAELSAIPAEAPAPSPLTPPARRTTWIGSAAAAAAWAVLGAAVLVAVWQMAATRSPDLPTPGETLATLRDLLAEPFYDRGPNDKGLGNQVLVSLRRVGTGFLVAAAVGVPLGLLIGASRRAWRAVNPIVQVLRPVSPLAWFPIWLTVSDDAGRAAVMVIFVTALWPVVINTAAAAATIPAEQQNVARVFRFGRRARLRHVLVPNALPGIFTGLRLSMGIAWMVIVAVEMLSGSSGIGFFVWDSYNTSNLPAVTAAIVVIGVVGMTLDAAFLRLARHFSPEARS